ncbi:MAG: hypothetical protein J0I49_08540 [Pseudonocardia sp.]|uniref:hypothetical protein n=1 Tax=Pseudonocardia sp. TaxID=60912 RepID=UPI001ACD742E|nr:hypothetical protein [Pseudonocardia sp.]MBN9098142.1 hypothetical protein [Pseudonocardia sp.]
MVVVRTVVAVFAAVVLVSACGGPRERDLHRALESVRCDLPESQYQQLPDRLVLSISVSGCTPPDSHSRHRLLTSAEATALVAKTAWSAPTVRFDSLFVTDYRPEADDGSVQPPTSQELSREALAAEFGQRDPDPDTPPSASFFEGRASPWPWMMIPPLAAIVGLGLSIGLVRAIRRGGISVLWIVR